MKIAKIFISILILLSVSAHAVDLRQYFPANNTVTLRDTAGNNNTRYTFQASPAGYLPLYNQFLTLNKPGYHYLWKKEYWQNSAYCTATDGILFMGDDLSVTEVGDWYASTPCTPNTVFGYKTAANVNTGLIWSPAGGILTTPTVNEMNVWRQLTPGAAYAYYGSQAYSKSGLVEALATYKPPYGRNTSGVWGAGNGTTYTDVVHVIMYHGTKDSTTVPIRCDTPPIAAQGPYYQSFKNYNSYGIELWIAKNVGIIQENTLFIEDGTYWGLGNCIAGVFAAPYVWSKFKD